MLIIAARIDGASRWHIFWKITLPQLRPAYTLILITSVIWGFQIFAPVYMMTEGRPGGSTYVLGYYIYQQAFNYNRLGYAAAIAFLLFVIILGATVFQLKMLRKKWEY